ncbi:MAG: hypothetical protein WCI90_06365 [Chlorobium sp.]|nr:MAG: hypothetical protein FDX17_06910 [Chlorobium sp.]
MSEELFITTPCSPQEFYRGYLTSWRALFESAAIPGVSSMHYDAPAINSLTNNSFFFNHNRGIKDNGQHHSQHESFASCITIAHLFLCCNDNWVSKRQEATQAGSFD